VIEIRGASDDLIEIEGDIKEEFTYPSDEKTFLAISDGTLLSIRYDEHGFWRINRLTEGAAKYVKREGTDPEDDYSDVVQLEGAIYWVVCGVQIATQ